MHRNKNIFVATLIVLAIVFSISSSCQAEVIRTFTPRYSTNNFGDIYIVGNTILRSPNETDMNGTRQNNSYDMIRIDIDGDGSTSTSSSANFTLPPGGDVMFAGLYWGADTSAGNRGTTAPAPSRRGEVKFRTPTTGSYITLLADQLDSTGSIYQGFKDVTQYVTTSGTYTVADVQAGDGFNRHGGWSLVIVVRQPGATLRNLTVFDGFARVTTGTGTVSTSVSGFKTPASGNFTTNIGAVAYEGDNGSGSGWWSGDQFQIKNPSDSSYTNVSDSQNPASNFFNSSITRLGSRLTNKSPNYSNQMGFDIDIIESMVLDNGVTGADLRFTTGGDFYYPGVFTFATEIFQPALEITKEASENGDGDGLFEVGENILYTITLTNIGQEAARNIQLTDVIPAGTSYVPGSASFISGSGNLSGFPPAADIDDIGVNGTVEITFEVNIVGPFDDGDVITNEASVTYEDEVGTEFTATDDVDTTIYVPTADLELTKVVDGEANNIQSGDIFSFLVTIENKGPHEATGVILRDTLPPSDKFSNISFTPAPARAGIDSGNDYREWDIASIPNGGTFTVTVTGTSGCTAGEFETNIAEIMSADQFDIDSTPGNGNLFEDDRAQAQYGTT